ncbi:DUF6789 family protein [Haloarcula marismortui]|uniref:Histidine kinase n=1 Tax=Haloarcula marismortui ATCC 33799 TaxID=662475 RepID=M0K664_9EURY|nr:DUF6789 family protein [Haloarcula californiae]EMA15315.1 hypothetical protein C435_14348 [Haloarcula californiae ATCC 33799]
MSTTTETTQTYDVSTGNWKAGVLGGIAGSAVMGALILVMNTATLAVAIPSLYGLAPPSSPAAGLVVHLSHGAVMGVMFAGLARVLSLESSGKLLGLGVGWGVATWVLFAAFLMPVWLGAVGSPASPPFPNFAPPSLLWHVVYGAVLAVVYAVTADRI